MVFKNEKERINMEKWNSNYNLLVEYINSSEDRKREFNKKGSITKRVIVEKDGQSIQLGSWLTEQKRRLMRKYEGMTLKEAEESINMPEQEKYKLVKLLNLGVKYAQREGEEEAKIWNRNFELLTEYIDSSKQAREYFKNTGGININTKVKIDEEEIPLGRWVFGQKQHLMKKYQNMSLEEIENDKNIPKEEKRKMEKLLKLGVKYPEIQLNWETSFELLKEHINSSKKIKEEFEEKGRIKKSIIVIKDGKHINLGEWLFVQRNTLMKKYQNMDLEDIKKDENIDKQDKKKMIKLLELGVKYPQKTSNDLTWDEKFKILEQYINSSEEIKQRFYRKNSVNKIIETEDGQIINLDMWILTQKNYTMKKYQNMSLEEIMQDENIPKEDKHRMKKLLQLGVKYSKELKTWEEWFILLEEYINSSNKIKEKFERTGNISEAILIIKDGKNINLGHWLKRQRQSLMRQYQSMTVEQIKKDENIPIEDKEKMIKLLELGVSYSQYEGNTYDGQWKQMFQLLEKYINSSAEIKKNFEKKGRLDKFITVEEKGKIISIGTWLENQKYFFIKKNQGKSINSIEEVEKSNNFSDKEKEKIIKLLKLGMNLRVKEKSNDQIWEENYEALKNYINSDEEVKQKIKDSGDIKSNLVIKVHGETFNIGSWLQNQKQKLLKKYDGMSIEQIEHDEKIPETDKYKMKKILELGVSYPKIRGQQIGKATYDVNVENCDQTEITINNLKKGKNKENMCK